MFIETLLNRVGEPGLVALAVTLLSLPLCAVGLEIRRRGLRARSRWSLLSSARRPIGDLAPGRAVVVGRWRNLAGGRALIEERGARALVERGPGAAPVADGAWVLVAGYATRLESDPCGGDYRARGRIYVIEGGGDEVYVTDELARPERAVRAGVRGARVGSALVGVGIAIAVAVGALCYRAAYDAADLTASRGALAD